MPTARAAHPMLLVNSAARVELEDGALSEPFYFFSISQSALAHKPWRTGMVYILPRTTFKPQSPLLFDNMTIHVQQWASPEPVVPLAKLRVTSADFPFLERIRGHDDEIQRQRAQANPEGFPWIDDV